jgi:AraC family transcriptional regulator
VEGKSVEEKLSSGRFYGETLRSREVGGFVLTETSYSPDLQISNHSHEHAYFCVVRKGSFSEIYGRKRRTCHDSTVVFHPSQEPHSNHFHGGGGRCFNIQLDHKWLAGAHFRPRTLEESLDFRGGLLISLSMRLYQEFRQLDEYSPLAIEGLVLEMMAETSRRYDSLRGGKAPRWLEQAREMIAVRSSEPISLINLAKEVGLHPVHVARGFRRYHGCTAGEYIRQVRIEAACRQLTESALPLSEIALAAGFFDQGHFSRTFKRSTGLTPTEYRTTFRRR